MHKDFNVIIQNLKVLTKHPQETCLPNCKEKDERQKERKCLRYKADPYTNIKPVNQRMP
jgi:hypothetical protein